MPTRKRADDGYGSIQQPKLDRASPRENGAPHETVNDHPTVKPLKLLSYLVKLVTPPGGTILDPFAGSGSILVAAVEEGFDCVGIEQSEEYAEVARRRVEFAQLPEWEKAERERAAKSERRAALAYPSEEEKAAREWAAMYRADVFGEAEEPQGRLF